MNGTQLNSFGFANSSLAVKPNNQKSGFDLDSEFDRSAITLTKIKNFSFSSGTGGTIVLGGTNNGNGLLRVKDASGGTVVTLDNSGIRVTNGSIIIVNSAGGTVLDSEGIVSTTSFPSDYIFNNTASTITDTSYVALPGASLTPFVLSRSTKVLTFCTVFGFNKHWIFTGESLTIQGSSSVDGQIFSFPLLEANGIDNIDFVGEGWSYYFGSDNVSVQAIDTLSAGTQTLSLNYKVEGGTGIVEDYAFGYVVLGD